MSKRKAIIGIGNPLRGDDGIGLIILEELKKRNVPAGFSLLDGGTGGMKLLHVLKDFDEVIIIDAVYFDGKPGEYVFFKPEQVKSLFAPKCIHDSNLFEILELSKQLNEKLREIMIMGIQPKVTDIGKDLSSELKNRLGSMVDAIIKKIKEKGN